MILSDVSIKRPVFASVMSILLVVLGTIAFSRLSIREYPDVDPPVVSVNTTYQGASAEVVESRITQVLEQAVGGIEGLKIVNSASRDGRSNINLEFDLGRDIDAATNDVRDAVGRAVSRLPDGVDPPVIAKQDVNSRPMMFISLSSDRYSALELTDYARRYLVDRLSVVPGVGAVNIGGERRYAIRVWLDRKALAARRLTVDDVMDALRRNNVEVPAGDIQSVARDLTVRLDSSLRTADEFRALPLKVVDGYQVRLGEVASVELGAQDARGEVRNNGRIAIGLGIVRQSKSNALELAQGVRAEIDAVRETLPPGASLDLSYDESVFIGESIREIFHALGVAVALVIGVIFVFLRSLRATLIPVLAIPVSIVASFIIMQPLGYSVNVLTLLALVLAIGLVVDDAIVVLENVHRRIEEGEPPLLAAYRGSRQIAFAVIASTVVLVAVFVPISFMEGATGRLFREFGISLAAAVLFSGFVALTLTPMMCSRVLVDHNHEGRLVRLTEPVFRGLIAGYGWLLERALRVPLALVALAVLISGLAYGLYSRLPKELAPIEDRGSFQVAIAAPDGASYDYTHAQVIDIENRLKPLRDRGDVLTLYTNVAPNFGGAAINRGFIFVRLKPWGERERSQQELVREAFPLVAQASGARASVFNQPSLGQRNAQAPVQFVIGGPDYETVAAWTERIVERAEASRGLVNVDTNFSRNVPQLNVGIDRKRAADLGIPVDQIGRTLEVMLASRAVTTYTERGQEYDVILQARSEDRASPSDLANIFVRAPSGELISLAGLVTLREIGAPQSLNRVDRLPSITLQASLADGYTLGEAIEFLERVAAEELPTAARVSFAGEARSFTESRLSLLITFGMALLIVFLVLAAQFESWVSPLIIMLTVPLGITGGLATLAALGWTLNVFSAIGMILLIALMAKNGILIVEFANQLRADGASVRDAVIKAATLRLRPILMTSIATVIGALPLTLGQGAGVESRSALAAVVMGGLTGATVLTLFIVPAFYLLLAPLSKPVNAIARRLAEADRAAAE